MEQDHHNRVTYYQGIVLYNPNDYLNTNESPEAKLHQNENETERIPQQLSSTLLIIPPKKRRSSPRTEPDYNNNSDVSDYYALSLSNTDSLFFCSGLSEGYGKNSRNVCSPRCCVSSTIYPKAAKDETKESFTSADTTVLFSASGTQMLSIETFDIAKVEFPESENFEIYMSGSIAEKETKEETVLRLRLKRKSGRLILRPNYKLGDLPFRNTLKVPIFLTERAYNSEFELKLIEIDELMRGHPPSKNIKLDLFSFHEDIFSASKNSSYTSDRTCYKAEEGEDHDVEQKPSLQIIYDPTISKACKYRTKDEQNSSSDSESEMHLFIENKDNKSISINCHETKALEFGDEKVLEIAQEKTFRERTGVISAEIVVEEAVNNEIIQNKVSKTVEEKADEITTVEKIGLNENPIEIARKKTVEISIIEKVEIINEKITEIEREEDASSKKETDITRIANKTTHEITKIDLHPRISDGVESLSDISTDISTDNSVTSINVEDVDDDDDDVCTNNPDNQIHINCITRSKSTKNIDDTSQPQLVQEKKKLSIFRSFLRIFFRKDSTVAGSAVLESESHLSSTLNQKSSSRRTFFQKLFRISSGMKSIELKNEDTLKTSIESAKKDINGNNIPSKDADNKSPFTPRHVDSVSLIRKKRLQLFADTQQFYQDSILAYKCCFASSDRTSQLTSTPPLVTPTGIPSELMTSPNLALCHDFLCPHSLFLSGLEHKDHSFIGFGRKSTMSESVIIPAMSRRKRRLDQNLLLEETSDVHTAEQGERNAESPKLKGILKKYDVSKN